MFFFGVQNQNWLSEKSGGLTLKSKVMINV